MVLLSYGNQNRPGLLTKFFDVSFDDPELKKELRTIYREVFVDILHQLEEKISVWDRMKRVMSWVLRFKQILIRKIKVDAIKLHYMAVTYFKKMKFS